MRGEEYQRRRGRPTSRGSKRAGANDVARGEKTLSQIAVEHGVSPSLIGKEIFELLATDQTEESLASALNERYDDPNKEIESSVREFVSYLASEGVLDR